MKDNSSYLSMKADINSACDSFNRDRNTIISDIKNSVSNIATLSGYSVTNDTNISSFFENLGVCKKNYETIDNIATTVFEQIKNIYDGMKQALDDLDKLNELLEETQKSEPIKNNYLVLIPRITPIKSNGNYIGTTSGVQFSYDQYYVEHALWENKMNEIRGKITEVQSKIDNYDVQLKKLNNLEGYSSLSSLVNVSSNITVSTYANISNNDLKNLSYREAIYESRQKDLPEGISLEKVGAALNYSKEEIIDSLIESPYGKWYSFCDRIPSNFLELVNISSTKVNDASEKYGIKGNYNESEYTTYLSTVNIGGTNIEIVQAFDDSQKGFVYDFGNYVTRSNTINNLASYSDKFFNVIKKDLRIVLLDNVTLASKSKGMHSADGFFSPWTTNVYVEQSSANFIHILNHELSHRFDWMTGNDKNYYSSKAENNRKLEMLFDSEFEAIGRLEPISYYYAYNHPKYKVLECFAEAGALYFKYADEMRDFAPKTHDFYHDLFGDALMKPRSIKDAGSKVVRDNVKAAYNSNTQDVKNNQGIKVNVGETSKVSSSKDNTDSNTKLKNPTTTGESVTSKNNNGSVKVNLNQSSQTPKNNDKKPQENSSSKQVNTNTTAKQENRTNSDGSVIIGSSTSSEKTKANVTENSTNTQVNNNKTQQGSRTNSDGSVTIGGSTSSEKTKVNVTEKGTNTQTNTNTAEQGSRNVSDGSVIIDMGSNKIKETKPVVSNDNQDVQVNEKTNKDTMTHGRTTVNPDGSVTINENTSKEKEEKIKDTNVNNYTRGAPLKTEVDINAGVVKVYYPDGSMEIFSIKTAMPQGYGR